MYQLVKTENENICKNLNIYLVNERMDDYREKWLTHLKEMDNNRLPDLFFNSNQRAINTSKMV
jgi:predicted adenine nucleotide alpha hydrolase (AANH) superfamily ATPase